MLILNKSKFRNEIAEYVDKYGHIETTITKLYIALEKSGEPLVRCKDCKWWTKQEASLQGRCDAYGMYPTGEWYCARGERKDDEAD